MPVRNAARRLAYRGGLLADEVARASSRQAAQILRNSDRDDSKGLQRSRSNALAAVVSHAYSNVPYYRQVFDGLGIDPESA